MPNTIPVIFLLFAQTFNLKLFEQLFKPRTMQIVEDRPRHLAAPHSVHGRRVAGTPLIGEARPIDGDAPGFSPRLRFRDDRSTPIDDGPEHVEKERFYCWIFQRHDGSQRFDGVFGVAPLLRISSSSKSTALSIGRI